MNTPIRRLFVLVLLLFGSLVFASSWWSVFGAEGLNDNPANRRILFEEQRIKRGIIRAADGTVLAANRKLPQDRYERRYPTGELFAQPVGFTSLDRGRIGLEDYYNDPLTGRRNDAIGALERLLGPQDVGDDLRTTLDPRGQEIAYQQLGDRNGAVVALDVKTGAVRVLAATPSYDPNDPAKAQTFNRATQGRFPPGSTMKVVTATAALDSGKFTPNSTVSGENGKVISGTPLDNFGGEDFGDITLTEALTNSVNTVWASVAEKLGKETMAEYMKRYGFFEDPPMDYPDEQMVPSGEVGRRNRLLSPTSGQIDVGRMAIGQDKLLVTPLQMATVAQTVANGGVRMKPRLVQKIVDPDGRTIDEPLPEEAERVMSEESANALAAMMKNVVEQGTGTAARLEGVDVSGKTGTAEVGDGTDDLWFIGFTGEVAVVAMLERQTGGTGGETAAPIAAEVLKALGQG
ncbi:MAG TPA: penicillin-binding protein 2 [Solirubrobacteraceae bacterium]|nr:penicillin-binding protein 2 [Solirubrobacteraceae bacterium]